MTQKKARGMVALTAQTQQSFVQGQRQIEFAADKMITTLPIRDLKEFGRGTQPLPQLSGAGMGMARFRRRVPFHDHQGRAQAAQEFELLSPSFVGMGPQRQLVQPPLKLRGRFRHSRAGGGSPPGLAPEGDGFFGEPGLGVMLREEFGLGLHHFGGMGCERVGNLRVQLLPSAAQQAAMRRVLH